LWGDEGKGCVKEKGGAGNRFCGEGGEAWLKKKKKECP